MLNTIACNGGKNDLPQTDTGKTSSSVDSMPIIKPSVKDSGGMVITPPVNDSNAVKPDTNNKEK